MAPPLQTNDFPYEYALRCERTIRRRRWNRSMGKVILSAVEPSALNIATKAPRAATLISVKVLFSPSQIGPSVATYHWTATLSYYLRIITYFSTIVLKCVPNQSSLKKHPQLRKFSTETCTETRECETLPWRLDRISQQGAIVPDDLSNPWTTTLLVPLNASETLLPTFLSPLLSR